LNAAIFFSAYERDDSSDLRSSSDDELDAVAVVSRVVDEVSGCNVDDGIDDVDSIRFDSRRWGKFSRPYW
jgi:hypothetical protein